MALRIEDYGFLGDRRGAALVGRDGSVDWLCVPRFDSGACFAALLGTPDDGRWKIAPAGGVRRTERAYGEGDLVLSTTFETADGTVRVTDCMPLGDGPPRLLRLVEGVAGRVPMEMDLTIRFDHGSVVPWVRRRDWGIVAVGGPDALRIDLPVDHHGEDFHTVARFEVSAGDRVPFALAWHPSHEPVPEPVDVVATIADTRERWRTWSDRCTKFGLHDEEVERSLIVLKALTYAPTGGIVAAPTTSLPEEPGGSRNWDYRYCWLRDATLALDALISAGYLDEARSWRDWLVRAVAGDPEDLQIMYGVAGERRLTEFEAGWLPGYEGSRPVRLGNGAHEQRQLDVYGEVLDLLHQAARSDLGPDGDAWRVQRSIMNFLEGDWDRPDNGLWEMRGPPRQFTHSKVMAWVAADRAVRTVERFGVDGPLDRWRALRDEIHADVCTQGYDPDLESFVLHYGARTTDAALLTIPLVGFLPADDERVLGTIAAVERELSVDGLLRRYVPDEDVEGIRGGEGAFLLCTFWLADAYEVSGRREDAERLFDRLCGLTNDLGLLSEEYDPVARRQLGNFPQAFSHIGLITTAHNLAEPETGAAAHRYAEGPGAPSATG
ncbi:MAG: glycoside hydrolase family 15 protein [Actinomycetota bacterium]